MKSSRRRYTLKHKRLIFLLHYDPETGVFTRLINIGNRHAGDRAGSEKKTGYRYISIDGVRYSEHWLAWFYVYGTWPTDELDHINGDPSQNQFRNLRAATHHQNMINCRRPRDNTSGFKGVCYSKEMRRWKAEIRIQRRKKHLGYFDTPEAAHDAYKIAAVEAFGEFARFS